MTQLATNILIYTIRCHQSYFMYVLTFFIMHNIKLATVYSTVASCANMGLLSRRNSILIGYA